MAVLTNWSSAVGDILGEPDKRAVEGLFYFHRENAGGQLVKLKMIGNAFTALALSGARFIGAVVGFHIGFNLAFHIAVSFTGSTFLSFVIA